MAIGLGDNLGLTGPLPVDSRYLNGNIPWASTGATNAALLGGVGGVRYTGLTVNILGVEYWYKDGIEDGDLIVKQVSDVVTTTEFNSYTGTTQAIFTDTQDPTGFINNDNIVVTYNNDRTITLSAVTGTLEYYFEGVKHTLGTSWTSSAHADTTDAYFLYSTDGTNINWSTTPWNLTYLMVAARPMSTDYSIREIHGTMPWEAHLEFHQTIGTYRVSGFGFTDGTYDLQPVVPTNSGNTIGFEAGVIKDEDINTSLAAWLKGTYTHLHFTGASSHYFATGKTVIFDVGSTYPLKNFYDGTGFTQIEMTSGEYANWYILRIPVTSDAISQQYRAVVVQPQFSYSLLASAQAENPLNLYLGDIETIAAEYVFVERITMGTDSGYSTTGKVRIEALSILSGTRLSQVNTVAGLGTVTAGNVSVSPQSPYTQLNLQSLTDVYATDIQTALSSGGLAMSGSTVGGLTTYVNSGTICAQPNATFNGSLLNVTGCASVSNCMHIGSPACSSTRALKVGVCGMYLEGNLQMDYDKTWFIGAGALSDTGTRMKLFTNSCHAYFDYYDCLIYRSGPVSSINRATLSSGGTFTANEAICSPIVKGTTCVEAPTIVATTAVNVYCGGNMQLIAPAASTDTGDIVFYTGNTTTASEWARIWTSSADGCLLFRSACDGLTQRCVWHSGNFSGGGVAWTGSTVNGLATYVDASTVCAEPNITIKNGNCLTFCKGGDRYINMAVQDGASDVQNDLIIEGQCRTALGAQQDAGDVCIIGGRGVNTTPSCGGCTIIIGGCATSASSSCAGTGYLLGGNANLTGTGAGYGGNAIICGGDGTVVGGNSYGGDALIYGGVAVGGTAADGCVALHHGTSEKLKTTTGGIAITGNQTITSQISSTYSVASARAVIIAAGSYYASCDNNGCSVRIMGMEGGSQVMNLGPIEGNSSICIWTDTAGRHEFCTDGTVELGGNILFKNSADKVISIGQSAANTIGRSLFLCAGTGCATTTGVWCNGGCTFLQGGTGSNYVGAFNDGGDGGYVMICGGHPGVSDSVGGPGGSVHLRASYGAYGYDDGGNGGNVEICSGVGGGTDIGSPGTDGCVAIYHNTTKRLNTTTTGMYTTGVHYASTCFCAPVICATTSVNTNTICGGASTIAVRAATTEVLSITDTSGQLPYIAWYCSNGTTRIGYLRGDGTNNRMILCNDGGGVLDINTTYSCLYSGGFAALCGVASSRMYASTDLQVYAIANSCVSVRYNNIETFKTVTNGICLNTYCGFAVDWVATSDCRLKECIKPISNALSTVTQLCGICYRLCDDENQENRIGLIAQDVDKVLPEVVSHEKSDDGDEKYGITDEKLGIKYDKLTAVLIEAVKEQQTQITCLQQEINELKNK